MKTIGGTETTNKEAVTTIACPAKETTPRPRAAVDVGSTVATTNTPLTTPIQTPSVNTATVTVALTPNPLLLPVTTPTTTQTVPSKNCLLASMNTVTDVQMLKAGLEIRSWKNCKRFCREKERLAEF